MRKLPLALLLCGVAYATPLCDSLLSFLFKCADFGTQFGQRSCPILSREIQLSILLKFRDTVGARKISKLCATACGMQAGFYDISADVYLDCLRQSRGRLK